MADSLRHNIFLSINQENPVSCRYSSGKGAGFILPGGDTIPSTYLIMTEVRDTTGIVRHSRWYAQGAVWPVVEQVTVNAGQEEYAAVNICPPDEQPRPKTLAKGTDRRNASVGIYGLLAQLHGSDPSPEPALPPGSGGYDITVTPRGITVRGEGADRATVRLYDTAGRLWHEGDASVPIPTSHLTAGVYLLHLTSDTVTYTTKLTIAGH